VTFPAFKAGDSSLRGSNGGFDFHTPPPYLPNVYAGIFDVSAVAQRGLSGLLAFPCGSYGVFHRLLTLWNPLGIVLPHDLFGVAEYGCNEAGRDTLH